MTLLEAMADRHLFAPWFRDPTMWVAWRAFIAALFALPLTPEQLVTYQQCTGRTVPPQQPATEVWLVCGRRAGKSFILALCAVYLACFYDYRRYLAPGERGTVLIIATNSKQARVIVRYVRALLTHIPMLAKLIERETADAFDLTNGTTIEVHVASARSTRGYAVVAACLDEVSYFPTDDSANPDYDILDAIRPGMATIPNALLLCASSPHARRGAMWDAHRRHYGKDNDPVLIWQATTRTMNPSVPQRVIDEAYERDPVWAASEYGASFRSDLEAFVSREAVEACMALDVRERAPMQSVRYYAFVDPSGGSADSMSLAIGHREDDIVVVDALREIKPPFSPESAVAEFSDLLKSYRVSSITGDRYAGEWPRERFREHGISYEPAQKPKSDLYRDLLPVINSRKIDLLDHSRLIGQLCSLERRTSRGGRDSIDHAPGAHDDLANAVAGLAAATRGKYRYDSTLSWVSNDSDNAAEEFQRQRFQNHIRFYGGYYRQWR
jgi:hypothetical protein